MLADPTILISEDAFELVPVPDQPVRMAGQAKINHIFAISGIKLRTVARWKQVVDAAFIGRLIIAAGTVQTVGGVAGETGVTVGASKLGLETRFIESNTRRFPALPAHRCKGPSQKPRRSPLRTVRIETRGSTFHHALTPTALRHENLVLGIHKMLRDETPP